MHWLKWLYPGMNLKRWIFLLFLSILFAALGLVIISRFLLQDFWEKVFAFITKLIEYDNTTFIFTAVGCLMIIAGIILGALGFRGLAKSFRTIFWTNKNEKIVDEIFFKRRLKSGPAVAVIGGGTGLSTLLRCIKQITSNCTAIVATTDDGGSSGRLREEMGIIPPGDLRNCIVALADTEPLMAKLMQYRFKEGSFLSGHSFGNIFITAMAGIIGDMEKGLKATSEVLKVRGSVIPATIEEVRLIAKMTDGTVIEGETSISDAGKTIDELFLSPQEPKAAKSAIDAIMNADMLVIGPGSLYTSVITNLLIPEIKAAVLKTNAIKVYVCNVMTQPGETDGYSACDHVAAIYKHVGEEFFDYVIINKQEVSENILEKYSAKGAYPVRHNKVDLACKCANIIEANLISEENLVRHEPIKLAKTFIGLMYRLRMPRSGLKIFDYYLVKDSIRRFRKAFEGE